MWAAGAGHDSRGHGRASALWIGVLALALAPYSAHAARCRDQKPTSWDIQVAPVGEPGDPLIMRGRVISRDRHPLPGVTMVVYHADRNGNYNDRRNEILEPRLCGILITNANGEYRIRTTMPGGYGGYAPHIHVEIWGRRVPRQPMAVNLVLGPAKRVDPPQKPVRYFRWSRPREDSAAPERPVERAADGFLYCWKDFIVDAH